MKEARPNRIHTVCLKFGKWQKETRLIFMINIKEMQSGEHQNCWVGCSSQDGGRELVGFGKGGQVGGFWGLTVSYFFTR